MDEIIAKMRGKNLDRDRASAAGPGSDTPLPSRLPLAVRRFRMDRAAWGETHKRHDYNRWNDRPEYLQPSGGGARHPDSSHRAITLR